ncbi:hypothetical protein [Sphingobium estronivorans]|uniref:hypothetical protein n=1 Tax=Sphingobium estronivorans TaxID=1577690 RepID=UPI0013C2E902|nr:hypothetical protein [Sphingobium estronivorans]
MARSAIASIVILRRICIDHMSMLRQRGTDKAGKRTPREGKHRSLAEAPDKTERVIAAACGHCGTDVATSFRLRT